MHLNDLCVSHIRRTPGAVPPLVKAEHAFYLETCQRWIWVGASIKSAEVFHAKNAYEFLLRLSCGLESEIPGETDIFGQVKTAWQTHFQQNASHAARLLPWMQRVFEDTKDIRAHYLQNVGGATYGGLVRKLIRSRQAAEGPLLVCGAGQIARSIIPFLSDFDLLLYNRTFEKLQQLEVELGRGRQWTLLRTHEEQAAWSQAASVIICSPLDLKHESERWSWFVRGGIEGRSVIHLGGRRAESDRWCELPRFYGLDDLFELQRSLGEARNVQISRAIKACEQRALLRSLGTSLSIPHGWEDLAIFAS